MSWVYIQTESRLWTVGHYSPDGRWHSDSDHGSSEAAAQRVHWLNGGDDLPQQQPQPQPAAAAVEDWDEPGDADHEALE